jgi:hypothetical protein
MKIRQTNVGPWWGALMMLLGRMASYATFVTLGLTILYSYPTVSNAIYTVTNINLTIWELALLIILGLAIFMVIEYKFSIAAITAFNNSQWYKHDNPMRKDLEFVKKQNIEIIKQNTEIIKSLNKVPVTNLNKLLHNKKL